MLSLFHTNRYVIITLDNGKRFAGLWGVKSFASDEPSERDIYLEKVFKIEKESGTWTETDRSLLVKGQYVRSVEFIPYS